MATSSSIRSCNLDGTGVNTIVAGVGLVGQLTVDLVNERWRFRITLFVIN